MHVDEAGADDEAGGVENAVGAEGRLRTDAEQTVAAEPDVGDGKVNELRRIGKRSRCW